MTHQINCAVRYRAIGVFAFFVAIPLLFVNVSFARTSVTQSSGSRTTPGEKEIRTLEPGQVIKRELQIREEHYYQITLKAGQYAQMRLTDPINLRVGVLKPDGKEPPRELVNLALHQSATVIAKEVLILAEITGSYRIKIDSWYQRDRPVSYELTLGTLRTATSEDRKRLLALIKHANVLRLHGEKKAASYLEAIETGNEVTPLLLEFGDLCYAAFNVYIIGESYWELGKYADALDYFHQALAICRTAGDWQEEAHVLISIGQAYQNLSEYQKALDAYDKALSLSEGEREDIVTTRAWALDNIGVAYDSLGEKQKALEYHLKAASLYRSIGSGKRDARGTAHALTRLGALYASLGEKQKGIEFLEQALPFWRTGEDAWGEARVFQRLGVIYASLGDTEKALDYYNQALSLWLETGDADAEAGTRNAIGLLYVSLSNYRKAVKFLHQSLAIRRQTRNREGEASTLTHIGVAYRSLGDIQQALEYYRLALLLWKEIGNRDGEGATLSYIGDAHLALGAGEAALDRYNEALAIRRAVQDPDGEADTLYGIARAERDRGDLQEARAAIKQALQLVERIRSSVASDELRASYLGKVRDYYELYIDLLMQSGLADRSAAYIAEALNVSERKRARVLLELLASSGANIREGVDPALLETEQSVKRRLDAKHEYQIRLLAGKHKSDDAATLAKEIKSLTEEYQDIETRIRASSPRYAALTQPEPLTALEIQQQLLDSETILLEYALGEKRSYVWVVTDKSLNAYELPGRSQIESAALLAYQLLNARNVKLRGENGATRRARIALADKRYAGAAANLSGLVLAPVTSQLGKKRLVIVADGALQYIPFPALPVPVTVNKLGSPWRESGGSRGTDVASIPLIADHEILSLPSASALAVLRREMAGRKPADRTIAILADPVFSSKDGRVQASIAGSKAGRTTPTQSLSISQTRLREIQRVIRELNDSDFAQGIPRLLGTRWEAEQIKSLAPEGGSMIALDFAASRETAVSGVLSNYRIVHFASHALIDNAHPELSGIVLSLVDERGEPKDGFLRAHEIFNLKLPAELVVLNACRTGLGKDVRGEGMIGLTRGFMYAGAARVLVSLWSLDDRASAELMKRVYTRMFGPEKLSPAAALRAAQVEMWQEGGSRSPYFWAAFSLQGEWK